MVYEDKMYPAEVRQLAALVASKVYYHLDSYVDSLVLLPWRQDPVQNDQHGHPPDCLFRKRKIIINIAIAITIINNKTSISIVMMMMTKTRRIYQRKIYL